MIEIDEYMKLSRDERRAHLRLTDSCVERGGFSTQFRGLLAYFLDTSIPRGGKVNLCHACHNEKCSNPHHLYWGTATENVQDAKEIGTRKTQWEYAVEKYGYVEACKRRSLSRRRGSGKSAQSADLKSASFEGSNPSDGTPHHE